MHHPADSSERLSSYFCMHAAGAGGTGVLCILRSTRGPGGPGHRVTALMGREGRACTIIAQLQCFCVRPDNRKALRKSSFGGISPVRSATSLHSGRRGATGAFIAGSDSGAGLQVGLTHGRCSRSSAPTDGMLLRYFQAVCCDRRGFFRAAAEVHPAQLIQLSMPADGLFRVHAFSFSCGGFGSAPPVRQRRRFSALISSE